MKHLLLLRHARAVAKTTPDRERELAPDGRAQMAGVARRLAAADPRPDLALVSPSRRTRETWDLARAGLGPVPMRLEERIYGGDCEALLAVVREADDAAAAAILVGHNPTIHELAFTLVRADGRDALAPPADFPTAGLAVIAFEDDSWAALAPGSGRLVAFAAPDPAA